MMIPSAIRPWLEAIDATTIRQNGKPGAGVVLSTFIPLRLASSVVARSREGLHLQVRALPNGKKTAPKGGKNPALRGTGRIGIIAPIGAHRIGRLPAPDPGFLVVPIHRGTGSSRTGKPYQVDRSQAGSMSP